MKPKNLRSHVYHEIINDIFSCKIGRDSILNEKDLIERFQVSKSPVRDALIELCNEGILESIPRFGYRLVQYSKNYYDGILHYRKIVEPQYLNDLWDNITKKDIEDIETTAYGMIGNAIEKYDPNTYWEYNTNFHLSIAKSLKDDFYYDNLSNALMKQRIVFNQFYWGQWSKQTFIDYSALHKCIVEAIKDNDRKSAVDCLKKDVDTFIKY